MKNKRYPVRELVAIYIVMAVILLTATGIQNFHVNIKSTGTISLKHPIGRLRIGNELLTENPSFFYDEAGNLVTLRMIQDGNVPQAYAEPPTYGVNYKDNIEYLFNVSGNCMRIHYYGSYVTPSRLQVDETAITNLCKHLDELGRKGMYAILDGYFAEDVAGEGNWWLLLEMNGTAPSFGGLLWNSTVQSDFRWFWNMTLTWIKNYSDYAYKALVAIEPFSEWNGGGSPRQWSRNPFLYNGTFGLGNASLVSWQNWLRKKYNNNMNLVKEAWGTTGAECWNYTGTETNDFSSLVMSSMRTETARACDFISWYNEVIYNFTVLYCKNYWQNFFPEIYVAWEGYGQYGLAGSPFVVDWREFPLNNMLLINCSDYINFHMFGGATEGAYYTFHNDFNWGQFVAYTALGRALKKPVLIGESGFDGSQAIGWDSTHNEDNYFWWNTTISVAIQSGIAGVCLYWSGYYYVYETGNTGRIAIANQRLPYLKYVYDLYKAAENWIDKQYYLPITLFGDRTQIMGGGNGGGGCIFDLLTMAGYFPKYITICLDNGTFYPPDIPSDTEIILMVGEYSDKYALMKVNSFMESHSNTKLLLTALAPEYDDPRNHSPNNRLKLEDYFNTTWFPQTSLVWGSTYKGNVYMPHLPSNISVNTTLYNQTVGIWTSGLGWNGLYMQNWTDYGLPKAGTMIINSTNLNFCFVIQTQRVGWLSFTHYVFDLATADGCIGNWEAKLQGAPLILRKILETWGYYPPIRVDASQVLDQKVRLGFRRYSNDWASAYIANTRWGSNPDKDFILYWNFTEAGLNRTAEYIVFFANNETFRKLSILQLESGMTIHTQGNGSLSTTVIRVERNAPILLWTNGYIESETLTDSTYSISISSMPGTVTTSYVYIPQSWGTNPKISCNETMYHAYNLGNGLWKLVADCSGLTSWVISAG